MTLAAQQFLAAIMAVVAAFTNWTPPAPTQEPAPPVVVTFEAQPAGPAEIFLPNTDAVIAAPPAVQFPLSTSYTGEDGEQVRVIQTEPDSVDGPWRCRLPSGAEMVFGGFAPVPTDGTVCWLEGTAAP